MNYMNLIKFTLAFHLVLCAHFINAQCDTEAGTMDLTPVYTCNNSIAAVFPATGTFLEADDAFQYILHTSSTSSLGTVLFITDIPEVSFDPAIMTPGINYYFSAVAGNDDGSGNVDLSDLCLSVSPGTPITFNEELVIGCDGMSFNSCSFQCPITGGIPPYEFSWSNGSIEPQPTFLDIGTYTVTVTDEFSCTAEGTFEITSIGLPCGVNISGELSCLNPTITLEAGCIPNIIVLYQWSDSDGTIISNESTITVNEAGTYSLEISDFIGNCQYSEEITIEQGSEECGIINGQVIVDDNDDCATNAGELGLNNWLVKAENTLTGDEFFSMTDTIGNYSISVLPGDYLVDVVNPSAALWLPCETAVPATIVGATDVETIDFHIGKLVDCPLMQVDIGAPFFRRCFENNLNVHYCNHGTQTAEDAYVEVSLDPLLTFISATIPWTGPVGSTYTFDVGDVDISECGTFSITVETSCDAFLGESLCAEAHVFPDTLCSPPDPSWSGASLELTSDCDTENLYFTITNVGAGTMQVPLTYIVIEDGVMMMEETDGPVLGPGQSTTITVPANGSTYVVDVPQVANHPGESNPLLAIEGCGTNGIGTFSIGFVSQFPENDGDPFLSIDCHSVIGSYDPNDKRGFPLGYGEEHFIEMGQDLEYHIRFQNTGTDTAFNVRIEDVISEKLDRSTFRPGASSHTYEVDFRSDTVVFLFPNILLPDSNVNEPLSHGFVKFKIQQSADNELGDVIENTADIYFDFNEAVVTNTTMHKLGADFIFSSSIEAQAYDVRLTVSPNPSSGETTFHLTGNLPENRVTLTLFDSMGKLVGMETFISPIGKIDVSYLPDGLYFFQMKTENMVIGNGKLLKK